MTYSSHSRTTRRHTETPWWAWVLLVLAAVSAACSTYVVYFIVRFQVAMSELQQVLENFPQIGP